MTKFTPFIILLVLATLLACTEDNVPEPDQGLAFVKYYGLDGHYQGTDLIKTSDGNYLIFGTRAPLGDREDRDLYLVKVDEEGNVVWTKEYERTLDQRSVKIIEKDDNYLLLGNTEVLIGGVSYSKIFLLKINLSEDENWVVLRQDSIGNETAVDFGIPPSGGYVITGTSTDLDHKVPQLTTDITDIYTISLTENGEVLWEDFTGRSGFDGSLGLALGDQAFSVVYNGQTFEDNNSYSDFRLVKYGYTNQNPAGSPPYSLTNTLIIDHKATRTLQGGFAIIGKAENTDLNFSIMDTNFIDESPPSVTTNTSIPNTAQYRPVSLTATDSGYMLVSELGLDDEQNILLTKLNAQGVIEWEESFGGDREDFAGVLLQSKDGGYLFTGGVHLNTNMMAVLFKTNSTGKLLK